MADTTFVTRQTVIPADWLNDVNDTVYNLPLSTTAAQGAGLVGYDSTDLYAQNTVGWGIRSSGYAVNVLSYIAPAYWAAILDGTTTQDVSTEVQAAIDAIFAAGGGTLLIPGVVLCNTPIVLKDTVELIGLGAWKSAIKKDSTTTKAVTVTSSGALVVLNGGSISSNINCIVALDGTATAGRYKGRIADISLIGTLATPGDEETAKVDYGLISLGSVSHTSIERVTIQYCDYALTLPIIFASTLSNITMETCLSGLGIENGTSCNIENNYANNCRDWGYFLRDLKYSGVFGNACDSLNDPSKYPTRTRDCSAYRLRSLLGVMFCDNGDEETYGNSIDLDQVDISTITRHLSIGIGSDYTGANEIAWIRSTDVLQGTSVYDNNAYGVKSGGLTYGGANAAKHHNIYFSAQTSVTPVKFKNNIVAASRSTPMTETGWGNNITSTYLNGSATYDPASLADGAGATTTVTVRGAALGDFALVSFSNALQGITLTGWVSATDTVSVRFQNESGGVLDLASGTIKAIVIK